MTRRSATLAAVISALVFVIVMALLLITRPDVPVLWALLVIPCAYFAWFLRQAVAPDRDAPRRWRVRNALGCVCVGLGVPSLIFIAFSDYLFPAGGPDRMDQQGLGLLVVLAIVAALGGLATLLWGIVEWTVSVTGR